jgi:hypothetical protein
MSLLENGAENFSASFQDNHFKVNKVDTTWSIKPKTIALLLDKNLDRKWTLPT